MNNRAGEYKTNLAGELQYKSFLPKPLPPDPPIELDNETVSILSKLNRSLGILGRKGKNPPHFNGEMNCPSYYVYG